MTLPAFMERALKHPVPSKSETQELVLQAQAGCKRSRDRVILTHLRYVYQLAHRHCAQLPLEDVAQEGIFGLLKAIEKWSPRFQTAFTTYAQFWVTAKMLQAYRNSGVVKKCRSVGAPATPISPELFVSLDAISPDQERGKRQMIATLVDPEASPEEQMLLSQMRSYVQKKLSQTKMNTREQDILGRLTGNEERLQSIADHHHLSRERVRQIEIGLKKKLRQKLRHTERVA